MASESPGAILFKSCSEFSCFVRKRRNYDRQFVTSHRETP